MSALASLGSSVLAMREARLQSAFAALGVVHGYDQNAGRRDDAAAQGHYHA